jgi:transmembrane sensor
MNQLEFQQLLARYEANQCTEAEAQLVEEWAGRVLADGVGPQDTDGPLTPDEQRETNHRLWAQIRQQTGLRRPFEVVRGRLGTWAAGATAAAAALVVGIWLLGGRPVVERFGLGDGVQQALSGTIEVRNTASQPQLISLEDGSRVTLSPNAVINYPAHFDAKTRTVYLRGEAFFDVHRNPAKPFIVRTGNLVTEVLGTSFLIKADEQAKEVEVAVRTGRVSVYDNAMHEGHSRNGAILTPNQKIVYDRASRRLVAGLVEKPQLLSQPETRQQFVFDEARLSTVLARLQAAYRIDIVLENQTLGNCLFTGDLNDLSLYTQLDLICRIMNASYQQRGTSLFISGPGCD